MIQAVLEITIKFLTELISFELPVYMYIWFAVLFIFSMIVEIVQLAIDKESILNSILKRIGIKIVSLLVVLIIGVLGSNFFAQVVEGAVNKESNLVYYILSTTIATALTIIEPIIETMKKFIKEQTNLAFANFTVSIICLSVTFQAVSNIFSDYFILAIPYKVVLIIASAIGIVYLVKFDQNNLDVNSESVQSNKND
ncbi:DUF5823 family protein [Bacillus atrophaeus]|uniref:DUF5823 family protein n=1 Tax=Bacillus atrophaeus TaxID=1452 RepID=UPI0007C43D1A|nr:DUF5823 family protein [Bacillus atrophaeus]MCY8504113.1 DUF5823 family protein [Bacillus atrophaeus]MCY8949316.1 DUF5823 family protein [Bacillus atrophaeus]MCY8968108.1 DUF5823 family protein [Bacillus atrophaeus]QUF65625.1 hypothetical protein KCX77_01180 [Bacillus atrophaeus]WFE14444.1 DUF5823 family protein [Bacillus atrophaeus]